MHQYTKAGIWFVLAILSVYFVYDKWSCHYEDAIDIQGKALNYTRKHCVSTKQMVHDDMLEDCHRRQEVLRHDPFWKATEATIRQFFVSTKIVVWNDMLGGSVLWAAVAVFFCYVVALLLISLRHVYAHEGEIQRRLLPIISKKQD